MKKPSNKKEFQTKGREYFIGFIPQKTLKGLSTELYSLYSRYRRNHFLLLEGEEQIVGWKKDIQKLKKKIKDRESKLRDQKGRMLEGYSEIGYLSKDYDFNCSINLRLIKSKRLKLIEKGREHLMKKKSYMSDVPMGDGSSIGRNVNNPSHSDKRVNMFKDGGGKNMSEFIKHQKENEDKHPFEPKTNLSYGEKYYVRIEPKMKERYSGKKRDKWIRNLYVGKKEDVLNLSMISDPDVDWSKKSEKVLRDNLREIYKGYVRYQIYSHGVINFRVGDKKNPLSQHPLDKVLDWIVDMGDEMFEWMDK